MESPKTLSYLSDFHRTPIQVCSNKIFLFRLKAVDFCACVYQTLDQRSGQYKMNKQKCVSSKLGSEKDNLADLF